MYGSLSSYINNDVRVNFIDIGQGDSCLIRSRNKNILIDTGGITFGKGDNGKGVLLPYLKKNGVKTLDYVFISHLDGDHCKNLKVLSENMEIKNLVFRKNGYVDYIRKYGNLNVKKVVDIESSTNILIEDMEADIFQISNSIVENEKSIIINLKINDKKILFTGDIGFFTENQILKNNIKCDYLKVAHHGSKNSTSTEFLKSSSPKECIISCGYKNRYGHPHKSTLDRILNEDIKVNRTDLDGNIILQINRFNDRIIGFNNIREDLLSYISFYKVEFFSIILYMISLIWIVLLRRKYELYTGFEVIG